MKKNQEFHQNDKIDFFAVSIMPPGWKNPNPHCKIIKVDGKPVSTELPVAMDYYVEGDDSQKNH